MVRIEEILTPGERIIKVQEKITLGNKAGTPMGDLYLTDRRLIFLHSKAWSMLSPVGPYISPAGALLGKTVAIQLQDIRSVSKNVLGYLKVQTDTEYQFNVSFVRTKEWVETIQQAIQSSRQAPMPPPPPPPTQSPTFPQPPRPPASANAFCTRCGNLLGPQDKFCRRCGASARQE